MGAARDNQMPPQNDQRPILEEDTMGDQVAVVPPPMTNGGIREAFLTLEQSMHSQAIDVTSKVQAMITQVNKEV